MTAEESGSKSGKQAGKNRAAKGEPAGQATAAAEAEGEASPDAEAAATAAGDEPVAMADPAVADNADEAAAEDAPAEVVADAGGEAAKAARALEPEPEAEPEPEPKSQGGREAPPGPTPELAHAEARIAALVAEAADLKDRLLRAAAETENRARRAEREVADARQYAVTSFAREIVQVGDNLRRAIEAVPPADQAERPPVLATLLEGIEATERVFLHVLGKHGVRRLEPRGEKFDANFHQAMFETDAGDAAPGTVTNVLQPGYAIGERVLRPALVAVAKSAKAKPTPS
ncbi:MAG: nucleotide exchange factor GrpE [Bauldia sp.]